MGRAQARRFDPSLMPDEATRAVVRRMVEAGQGFREISRHFGWTMHQGHGVVARVRQRLALEALARDRLRGRRRWAAQGSLTHG